MRFGDLFFEYVRAKSRFEDELIESSNNEDDFDYERIGGDDYDASIELYGVGNHVRLNARQQRLCHEAGFTRCWLNHKDGMETFYYWGHDRLCGFGESPGHRKLGYKAQSPQIGEK